LKQTILDQKIDEHKDAYLQSKIYLHKAKEVRRTSLKWQEEMEGKSDLTDVIKSIQGEFTKIVPYEVPAELAGEDEFRKLYEHFRELFHNNLLHLLKNVANTPKVAKGLFEEMAKDAEEAIKLLDQTLPVEDVIAAFYSSLWAPRKVRKQNYKETLKSISRHLKVACAQASSSMEPDRVIGPNEELYTNILTALAELDKALGLAGSKDPIHANLKKLFEIAKAKWEVMTIDELRAALCQLHERVEACNSRLIKYFNENGEAADFALNGRLAKTLRPLATALGKNQVPYPKPFPIDSAVLDAAKDLKAAITRLRSRQASSDDHSWVEDLQYLNDQIDELNDLNRVGVAKLPSINLPRRPVVRNIMSDTVSLETELGHLEKSLDSIETNPYFTSGVDFQKRRMNAIQQHSQKKVSGTKVTLL
jgi:isopenicillin N synthase-like dioxygenase